MGEKKSFRWCFREGKRTEERREGGKVVGLMLFCVNSMLECRSKITSFLCNGKIIRILSETRHDSKPSRLWNCHEKTFQHQFIKYENDVK